MPWVGSRFRSFLGLALTLRCWGRKSAALEASGVRHGVIGVGPGELVCRSCPRHRGLEPLVFSSPL